VLAAFQEHIGKNFPKLKQERFVLACSGGIDSIVLAHLCKTSELDFVLAHCNFQLRANDSMADEEFVREAASSFKVPFFVTHFDTVGYMDKNKVSVQMAARTLRYKWFAEIMQKNQIKTLVTAHHADDNLETFLINLSRGTGIDGLTGIPASTDAIARPLLPFSRNEIEAYAHTNQIDWREDKSNEETKYLRNKIRHDIVPLLKELHPTFLANFSITQSHLQHTSELVKASTEKIKEAHFEENDGIVSIKVSVLLNLYPLKTYLHELFKEYGFTAWDDIVDLLSTSSGKEVRSRTHRLVKNRDSVLLTTLASVNEQSYAIQEEETEILHPIGLRFEEVTEMKSAGSEVLYVDKKTLKYPLTVRKWKNGDYFYPLGMQGKKKLSKYFKDEKIDVISKDKQWLLYSAEALVWVIGRRGDNRFEVSDATENIIKITLK